MFISFGVFFSLVKNLYLSKVRFVFEMFQNVDDNSYENV